MPGFQTSTSDGKRERDGLPDFGLCTLLRCARCAVAAPPDAMRRDVAETRPVDPAAPVAAAAFTGRDAVPIAIDTCFAALVGFADFADNDADAEDAHANDIAEAAMFTRKWRSRVSVVCAGATTARALLRGVRALFPDDQRVNVARFARLHRRPIMSR